MVSPADVQKLELELILILPDELIFQHRDAHPSSVVKRAAKPAASIIAVEQEWGIFFGFVGRLAGYIVVFRLENQSPVLRHGYRVVEPPAQYLE